MSSKSKAKKVKATNCDLYHKCCKGEICKIQLNFDNYIESMVLTPECFLEQEQVKIKIEIPKFLRK